MPGSDSLTNLTPSAGIVTVSDTGSETGPPDDRTRVLGALRKVAGPMSWDYAIEQAMRTGIGRTEAERYLRDFMDRGTLARDPEGYLRFTK